MIRKKFSHQFITPICQIEESEPTAAFLRISDDCSTSQSSTGEVMDCEMVTRTPFYPGGDTNGTQYFSLRWNNYQDNITQVFQELLEAETFVDCTLACEDKFIKAHKIILSACSEYFQKILTEYSCDHPTIVLPTDVSFVDLQFIVEFVYRGEIDVSEAELQSLLRTADYLKIKGLCELTENREETNRFIKAVSSPSCDETTWQSRINSSSRRSRDSLCEEIDLTKEDPPTSARERRKTTETDDRTKNDRLTDTEGQHDNLNPKKSKMASLGMGLGMNGALMSVPMGYLDFAPEPPAPTATPVTEHVDLSCNPTSTDTRDISNFAQPPQQRLPSHSEIRIKFETLRSMEAQEAMVMEGEATNGHAMQALDTNGQLETQSNGTVSSSGPENLGVQNVITTVMAPINGNRHHPDPDRNSPDNRNQLTPTSISSQAEMESVHIKVEQPEPSMQVIVKQETISPGNGELYNSDTSEDSKMVSNGSRSISPNSQYGYANTPNGNNNNGSTPTTPANNGNGHANETNRNSSGPKTWTQEDMDGALDALRNHNMSLTKASVTYGIPSTTLWQRAHRLGIDTPKKEGPTKSWSEEALNNALDALRTGTISANKASKAFGIPSSTLYKIARREGIRLAAPFNAAPTTWTQEDLERALESIRAGQSSVQRASTEFGIPTGTLYGRCKREGIELSRSNPTPWSENAMMDALEAVRVGQMSINQAAIHYNLPYSSLYGRFKRGKYEAPNENNAQVMDHSPENSQQQQQQQHQQSFSPALQQQQQQQQQGHHQQQHVVIAHPQQHMQQIQLHHQSPTHQQMQPPMQHHTMAITISRNSVNPLDLQQQDVVQNNAMNVIQPHYLHTQPLLQGQPPQLLHPLHHQFGTYPMERFEIKQEKN